MSDRMMPLDEALEWVAQDKSTRSTARAARAIVHLAGQTERLQAALRTVTSGVEGLGLWPQDMEPPA